MNTKQTKEITCTLPPVLCETQSIRTSKIKSTSAPAQCQQPSSTSDEFRGEPRKTKTRQASVQLSKQYKAKQMQSALFNHPGKTKLLFYIFSHFISFQKDSIVVRRSVRSFNNSTCNSYFEIEISEDKHC